MLYYENYIPAQGRACEAISRQFCGAAETPVGGPLVRGISGGQKRRVTLGESLVAAKSVYLMDEACLFLLESSYQIPAVLK